MSRKKEIGIQLQCDFGRIDINNEKQIDELNRYSKLTKKEYLFLKLYLSNKFTKKDAMIKAGFSQNMAKKNPNRVLKNIENKVGKSWLAKKEKRKAESMVEAWEQEGVDFNLIARRNKRILEQDQLVEVVGADGQIMLVDMPIARNVDQVTSQFLKSVGGYAPEQKDITLNKSMGEILDDIEDEE